MSIYSNDDSGLPLGKLILGSTLVIVLVIAGFQLYAMTQADKKAEQFLAVARDHTRLQRPEQALQAIEQSLRLKEKPEALELKANIQMNQNHVYAADKTLERLIELKPDNAHYRYMAGIAALNEEELNEASEHLREAVRLEPQNADYAVALANMLHREGKTKEAKAQYEALIKKDPQYKIAWQQYQLAFSNSGAHEEAVKIAERALKQFPNDSDFYFLLATTFDNMGKKAEAVAAYRKSLELEPMQDSVAAQRIYEITGKHVPLHLENMAADSIPFESRNKLMYVEGEVNGRKGRFLLDTGASVSVIYASRIAKYNLLPSPLRIEVQTANGVIQVPVTYGSVKLGRQRVEPVVLGVLPDPKKLDADGIIGMNVMSEFRMEIDRNARRIVFSH